MAKLNYNAHNGTVFASIISSPDNQAVYADQIYWGINSKFNNTVFTSTEELLTLIEQYTNSILYYSAEEAAAYNSELTGAVSVGDDTGEDYTAESAAEENAKHLVEDASGKQPSDDGYSTTYEEGYNPVSEGDDILYNKETAAEKNETLEGAVHEGDQKPLEVTIPPIVFADGSTAYASVDTTNNHQITLNIVNLEDTIGLTKKYVTVNGTDPVDTADETHTIVKWVAPESSSQTDGLASAADVASALVDDEKVIAAALTEHNKSISTLTTTVGTPATITNTIYDAEGNTVNVNEITSDGVYYTTEDKSTTAVNGTDYTTPTGIYNTIADLQATSDTITLWATFNG